MKSVPYIANPGNACALACYTMAAQYLIPEEQFTFEQFAKIAGWREGYIVWGFSLWKWLMDQGIHVTDYDTIDYEAWATDGMKGLQKSVPAKEFQYYKENTYDLEQEGLLVEKMLHHPNFTYKQQTPKWADLIHEFNKPGICDVTLNARRLNKEDGFSIHRVVLIDISDDTVTFHDPNKQASGAYRKESLEHFRRVFESMEAPELARYYL